MNGINFQGKCMNYKKFYTHNGVPRLPDERFKTNIDYNYLVAQAIKSFGYTITQELPLPEWGIVDIFAYKGDKVIIAECKSEKDRSMMRALGQIITYTSQLYDVGYNIQCGYIFTRTEPARQRIKKEIELLNKHLPFRIEIIRVSNNTPLSIKE